MATKKQVCVLGGGVCGLSVAARLLEVYGKDIVVTVIADKFSPLTTASDRSASIVLPTVHSTDSIGKYPKWLKDSLDHLDSLYQQRDGDVGETGITYIPGYFVKPEHNEGKPTWYKQLFPTYHEVVNSPHAKILPFFENKELVNCTTYTIDPTLYLSNLMERIQSLGGILVTQRIANMAALNSYHAIVNCTGMGAKELADDPNVYPIKGILVSVRAPWVKEWILEGVAKSQLRIFVIPRVNDVVLGGYNEEGCEDTTLVDEGKVKAIIDRCSQVFPSLAKADVLNKWCGVRPMRKGGIRLEEDNDSVIGSLVVHDYGHGAHGMSLSWGCAQEVGDIIGQSLGLVKKPVSKL